MTRSASPSYWILGGDAIVGSDLPVLYLDVTGKRHGCTLNIVGGEYSASV